MVESTKTVHIYTKKLLKTQYHLASFNKPLTEGQQLPAHIVEQPAEEPLDEKQQFENA